jgi:hypothetical protein
MLPDADADADATLPVRREIKYQAEMGCQNNFGIFNAD